MYVIVVGANHKIAPVEMREKLSFAKDRMPDIYSSLLDNPKLKECIIISTCNRTEVYAASGDTEAALESIKEFLSHQSGINAETLQAHLYTLTCKKAIEHLFRVAAGLDSMILGENEILGQVSEAYEMACASRSSGIILNTLFQRAISVGKKVRTETGIGCGVVSVGSAAVQLAAKVLDRASDCNVLLIGAGEMGQLVARHIAENKPSRIIVCNRSHDRAIKLASEIGAVPVSFEDLLEHLVDADIVISCTASPGHIISMEQLRSIMDRRGNRPQDTRLGTGDGATRGQGDKGTAGESGVSSLESQVSSLKSRVLNPEPIIIIDIAVPRDVEPEAGKLKNVYLYNIDDLQSITDAGLKQRQSALSDAEEIVKEKVDAFLRWINSSSVTPVIKLLHDTAATIRDEELIKAFNKLGELTEREEKIIRSMAKSIVSRLIYIPVMQLKEHAGTDQGHLYTQVARSLFGFSGEEEIKDAANHET